MGTYNYGHLQSWPKVTRQLRKGCASYSSFGFLDSTFSQGFGSFVIICLIVVLFLTFQPSRFTITSQDLMEIVMSTGKL